MAVRVVLIIGLTFWTAAAKADQLSCQNTEDVTYACTVYMHSHSATGVMLPAGCSRAHAFYGYDTSRRVDMYADGRWFAPGRLRMRKYHSPLGPLRIFVTVRSKTSFDMVNRSRFGVGVLFKIDCV